MRPGSIQGLTLMEVVISTSILGMVMLIIFNLYPTSFMAVQQGRHRMEAETLASSLLEEYGSAPYSTLTVNSVLTPDELVGQDGVQYQPQIIISQVETLDPNNLVMLEAVIRWDDKTGSHEVRMANYVANLP